MDAQQRMVLELDDLLQVRTADDPAGGVTITLAGELDLQGVEPFDQVLADVWARRPGELTVDLRQLGFISARGLACLISTHRTARERGVPLLVLHRPGLVSRMLVLVGLGELVAPTPAPVTARAPVDPGFTALVELDLALSRTGADVAATCEVIVARLRDDVPRADHAALCGASARRLRGDTTASSVAAAALVALEVSAREGPSQDARRYRETVHVRDLHHDERWPGLARQATRQAARSVLTVPLVHEDELIGVLTLHSDHPDAFDPAARDLAAALAARAATALGCARIRDGLAQAIRSRDVIGQGKGILMARHGLTAQQAFDVLSRASQERNVRVVDLAEDLARTGAL